jgi:hypothetical protein
MLPTFLLYIAMGLSTLTETPFIALDLATNMSSCKRIEWTKMTDDESNVRFIITFHKMPLKAELGFERTLNQHKCCKSILKENNGR